MTRAARERLSESGPQNTNRRPTDPARHPIRFPFNLRIPGVSFRSLCADLSLSTQKRHSEAQSREIADADTCLHRSFSTGKSIVFDAEAEFSGSLTQFDLQKGQEH